MDQVRTDVDLDALYTTLCQGIEELKKQAMDWENGLPARALYAKLAVHLNEEGYLPDMSAIAGAVDDRVNGRTGPAVFPEMTTMDLAGELPLRVAMNLAHHGANEEDTRGGEQVGRRLMRTIDREIDRGADDRAVKIGAIRVAHAAIVGLFEHFPDFAEHFRQHGVQPKRQVAGPRLGQMNGLSDQG
jgi:hypothetical protein